MKRIFAVLVLAMSVLACGLGQSSDLASTQTALASTAAAVADLATQAAWTATPTSTPAIDYSASIGSSGADLFSGPGENYPKTITLQGDVTIIGQAYSCSWFKVASVSNSTDIGWISADNLTYSVNCSDVKLVAFPPAPQPTPTDTPLPSPTATATKAASIPVPPGSPNVNCEINSNIIIQNRSSDPFTLVLSGTANFTFYIGAGEYTTEKVCSGSYNYIVYGTCNGAPATGSGRISDGDQVYFVCN